ncbi:hypothetical protein VAR608DRAFT_0041 [Variovorax sp. HW608]|uniref:hypothetical protein n=1 Tax=Variovorax sp. HW608 TaxID=1034889 RepID=UPI00081FE5CA|nr:hypothetical protein [Variovorax sp. HW608]SCK06253.1 hypothetical protein VAR608DRAFT_0041 [Variovorax sp. HW608]
MTSRNENRVPVLARAAACLALAATGLLQAPAAFANTSDSKVLGGIERGANATGRGIERGADATRRGVNNTAERASAPVRRWGESLGRKLPHGSNHAAPPTVGPQGSAP